MLNSDKLEIVMFKIRFGRLNDYQYRAIIVTTCSSFFRAFKLFLYFLRLIIFNQKYLIVSQ